MNVLESVEIKAFIPAKNFELSQQFYLDLGFKLASVSDDVAYFSHGDCAFLLQDFYVQELAELLMMHLLVKGVDDWWAHVERQNIIQKYQVKHTPLGERPWRMRDFTITDPAGVLWRIGENTQ